MGPNEETIQDIQDEQRAARASVLIQSSSDAGEEGSEILSEKLGTINVLGMSRTVSQDRAIAQGVAATSTAPLGSIPFTPRAPIADLRASPELVAPTRNSPTVTANVLDSTKESSSGVNLSHKDSFGQHTSTSSYAESSNPTHSSHETSEAAHTQREKSEVTQSPTGNAEMPNAFDTFRGNNKGSSSPFSSANHAAVPSGASALGGYGASSTLDTPLSPFAPPTNPQSAISTSSTFSNLSAYLPTQDAKDSKEELENKVDAENAPSHSNRTGKEETPRKSAIKQTTFVKTTTNNGTAAAARAQFGPSVTANTSTIRTAGGGTGKASRTGGHRPGPQLPSAPNVIAAPPPAMYWSKVPVHGSVPKRSFRAHTANLADDILWLFGGCDSKGCFRELWCFDTETMCWSKPRVTGDLPPPRRAHSASMVDKRLFVFAGGDGPYYFNDLYVFDTISLRWTKPEISGQPPSPRRAHTSNYYNGQLIIFGGGNGVGALNDVYSLDIKDPSSPEWKRLDCRGKIPVGRGYHTSNLVDGKLIVIGGSDGHISFNDIHVLRLDTKTWYQVKTDEIHNRLGHTATQVGSYLFIVGGHDSRSYTPEILTLNLVNLQWEPRRVCGQKPPGRGYHQAWLRDSRLFVHGGFDGKEIYDDLYFIDLAACAYLPQITSFSVELDDD